MDNISITGSTANLTEPRFNCSKRKYIIIITTLAVLLVALPVMTAVLAVTQSDKRAEDRANSLHKGELNGKTETPSDIESHTPISPTKSPDTFSTFHHLTTKSKITTTTLSRNSPELTTRSAKLSTTKPTSTRLSTNESTETVNHLTTTQHYPRTEYLGKGGCYKYHFYCDNKCIDISWLCDGEIDCKSGSDESVYTCGKVVTTQKPPHGPVMYDLTKACEPNTTRFQCRDPAGGCIPREWTCDGLNDCGDNSDEENCDCSSSTHHKCYHHSDPSRCIPLSKLCDGHFDCELYPTAHSSSDEYYCASYCSPSTHFRCPGDDGRCFPNKHKCDGSPECSDMSDEKDCKCKVTQTRCADHSCVYLYEWCDGFKDCRDGSDEVIGCNQSCPNGGTRCKTSGVCMNFKQICDKIKDCDDGSDEANCGPCESHEYQCSDKKCIDKAWLCDGTKDCSSGEDETLPQCANCSSSMFRCVSTQACINNEHRCDGVAQCHDQSDEANCLSLDSNGTLKANNNGTDGFFVCLENWQKSWSDVACFEMGLGESQESTELPFSPNSLVLGVSGVFPVGAKTLTKYLIPSSCTSNKTVALTCKPHECGKSLVTGSQGYIVNGEKAAEGAWPWQVLLLYAGNQYCGGSIISDRWIITAAHCTIDFKNASQLEVKAGSIYRFGSDSKRQILPVESIHTHPWYRDSEFGKYDIGLIKLKNPIQFNDYIQPLCVVPSTVHLDAFKVCVATGFGRERYESGYLYTTQLNQAKMTIKSTSECRSDYYSILGQSMSYSYDFKYYLCAGTTHTTYGINTCMGDSGGPLACMDQTGIWHLVGITSFGFGDCKMSVFARVSYYRDWIDWHVNETI